VFIDGYELCHVEQLIVELKYEYYSFIPLGQHNENTLICLHISCFFMLLELIAILVNLNMFNCMCLCELGFK